MAFAFQRTIIEGVYVIEPRVFGDERGYFVEIYQKDEFDTAGLKYNFVQSNQSLSHKGVLRGLHFQIRKPQAKLVRVVSGEVFDVAVDLRAGSSTYGKSVGVILSGDNHRMLMIPRGFAHGFLVLSDKALFEYQVDDVYDPGFEGGISYDDPKIGVQWPDCGSQIELSEKDKHRKTIDECKAVYYRNENKFQIL